MIARRGACTRVGRQRGLTCEVEAMSLILTYCLFEDVITECRVTSHCQITACGLTQMAVHNIIGGPKAVWRPICQRCARQGRCRLAGSGTKREADGHSAAEQTQLISHSLPTIATSTRTIVRSTFRLLGTHKSSLDDLSAPLRSTISHRLMVALGVWRRIPEAWRGAPGHLRRDASALPASAHRAKD